MAQVGSVHAPASDSSSMFSLQGIRLCTLCGLHRLLLSVLARLCLSRSHSVRYVLRAYVLLACTVAHHRRRIWYIQANSCHLQTTLC